MIIDQRDNLSWHKLNGFFRYMLIHFGSNFFPLYVVNEYPQSGGSWVSGQKLSGRAAGVEDSRSFLRKGLVGDWKNYFDKESSEMFHQYAGRELVKLGYEADSGSVAITGERQVSS